MLSTAKMNQPPAGCPAFLLTAVLVRQVLGAVSQFEKANLVAKLRAARERKIAAGGRGSGRFAYAQKVPEVVALVRELHGQRQSLRQSLVASAARNGLLVKVSAIDSQLRRQSQLHRAQKRPS
jgi:DNA invertase Pin-like site-specific DNA recombinase